MIIFRKNALDKISSAEELDKSINIVNPIGWLSLIALLVIAIVFVLWSFFASINTRVQSSGIFLPQDGKVIDAVSSHSGVLKDMLVKVGDYVEHNDIIAKLSFTEQVEQLKIVQQKLQTQLKLQEEITEQIAQERKQRAASQKEHLDALERNIELRRQEIADAKLVLDSDEKLYESRDITQDVLNNTRANYNRLRSSVYDLISRRADFALKEKQLYDQEEVRLKQLQKESDRLTDQRTLTQDRTEGLLIRAPEAGVVIESKVTQDAFVNPNTAIVGIVTHVTSEPDQTASGDTMKSKRKMEAFQNIEFIAYVNAINGKKIKEGGKVNIEVDYLDKNSYGLVQGKVVSISDFPLSSAGIYTKLANRDLVQAFTKQGPSFQVIVQLDRDKTSKNGFAWTTLKGKDIARIDIGSLGKAEFIISSKRPITLAIPILKSFLN